MPIPLILWSNLQADKLKLKAQARHVWGQPASSSACHGLPDKPLCHMQKQTSTRGQRVTQRSKDSRRAQLTVKKHNKAAWHPSRLQTHPLHC